MNISNRSRLRAIVAGKTAVSLLFLLAAPLLLAQDAVSVAAAGDAKTVAQLDTEYQAAVQRNDWATMNRILADDFVLVTGSGKVYAKSDLLQEAQIANVVYERQEDSDRIVRVWGDTAVVTARLWAKGAENSKPFDYRVWFSDTYVRTPSGWRYVFGQASLPLPLFGTTKPANGAHSKP